MRNAVDRRAVGIALAGVAALVAGAGVLLGLEGEAAQSRANAASAALEAVSQFAGGPPERCVYSAPDHEVCSWRVEGRILGAGGRVASSDGGPVTLVCEIPADASGEEPACRAHVPEANGASPAVGLDSLPAVSAAGPAGVAAELAAARTVAALSHLVGDVPDRCRTRHGELGCSWRLPVESTGHQRLAAPSRIQGPARLRCTLPLDGTDREADSCSLEPSEAIQP